MLDHHARQAGRLELHGLAAVGVGGFVGDIKMSAFITIYALVPITVLHIVKTGLEILKKPVHFSIWAALALAVVTAIRNNTDNLILKVQLTIIHRQVRRPQMWLYQAPQGLNCRI